MQTKGTAEVLRLVLKILYSFLVDRANLKKLILHTNREMWYIIAIILLVVMIASLTSQIAILEKAPTNYVKSCYAEVEGYVDNLQVEINRLKGELGQSISCPELPEPPTPSPIPNKPLFVPPPPPERRVHDVKRLLDDIH
jgi:hypothetical protein